MPYIALAVGVAAVSTSAVLVELTTAPSAVVAFYRLFFSALLILPYFLLRNLPELKTFSKKDWIFSGVAGVFLAVHFILWFESLNFTSVASSVVLVTLQPLFSFVGTYFFFKEKISFTTIVSAMVAIIGSVIISWGDFYVSGMALFGDFLALAACAMVTAYLLFGQEVRKTHSLMGYTFIVYSFSAVTLFIYCIALQYPLMNYPAQDWVYFLLLAIVPTLLGHSLFNWSLKWISTNVISVSILFEPVGAIILAYILLGETVIMSQVIGGFIIVCGIIIFAFEKQLKSIVKTKMANISS
ncbi:DMT family transporter [Domibacillus sp. PGB-M46]|uniref:DMT family transporter n=1 Tax=Domibacillus sp. PGB-M46 TaxID=2910255 RepID=UPI001F55F16A|nr:DMT family transporter [Domibacillus sp. PGB-M46]MCI2255376.1 DMT family transporter [Domibacillus sp. PGB-M46]